MITESKNTHKIPDILKHLRHQHCYTQQYVAKALGISRQAYIHYERGRTTPSIDSLLTLSKLYDIPINIFLPYLKFTNAASILEQLELTLSFSHDYIDFFNIPENLQKYKYLSRIEKETIYYFKKLPKKHQQEILLIIYLRHINK